MTTTPELVQTFLTQHDATLNKLTDFMLEYNARVNLTRITQKDEVFEKHYVDSILPMTLHDVPRGTSLLDFGSGAGFPGIPVKLFRADLQVTLLEATRKRTNYLQALAAELQLDYKVLNARGEEAAHLPEYREAFGAVAARAVANMSALCEYCLPFVKPPSGFELGGVFLAMKGESGAVEAKSAEGAIALLGGRLEAVHEYALPSGDKRNLVVVRKVRQTSAQYPRKRTNIVKNPLL